MISISSDLKYICRMFVVRNVGKKLNLVTIPRFVIAIEFIHHVLVSTGWQWLGGFGG